MQGQERGWRWGGLVLLCWVAYFPALLGDFVWDDRNILNRSFPIGWEGFAEIWFKPSVIPAEEYYWPLTYTSLWVDLQLWGKNPFGFHLTNILLHSANAILLFSLLLRLSIPSPWLAAAIFAVHPVHVDSVAWIIERKDVLSGFFCLSSLFIYARFHQNGRPTDYGASLLLFLGALLSKSVAVTLPASLFFLLWWKQDSVGRVDILRLMPFGVLSVFFGLLTLHPTGEVTAFDHPLSWIERTQLAAVNLMFYAWKITWPFGLTPVYPRWEIEEWGLLPWSCLGAAVLLTVFLFWRIPHWGKGPLVGWLCYVVTLVPMLGFFYFDYMEVSFVADRFQYLASAALASLLASSLNLGTGIRLPRMTINLWKQTIGTITLMALTIIGTANSARYRNEDAFWSKTYSTNPKSWLVVNNLAVEKTKQGHIEEAVDLFRQVTEIYPEDYKGFYNFGVALLKRGDIGGAREALIKGLALNPEFRPLHLKLAEVLELVGEPAEAEKVRLRAATLQSERELRHSETSNRTEN